MSGGAVPALGAQPGARLIEGLRAEIARGRLVVVAGTGVSVGACADQKVDGHPVARWTGLLAHGLEHCVNTEGVLAAKEAAALKSLCDVGNTASLIAVAERIVGALEKKRRGAYRSWLKETVGALTIADGTVIEALVALGGVLATLNYDTLLEQATGREGLTWRDRDKVEELLRAESRARSRVLHLHGHYDHPESVVLGLSSYSEITGDPHTATVLKTFALERTLLFVGCRGTVEDPNFERLVEWAGEALGDSTHRHYLLCASGELEAVRGGLAGVPWLYPIAFGDFGDLAPFLRGLVPTSEPAAVATVSIEKARGAPLELPPRPSTGRLFGRDAPLGDLVTRVRAGEDVCVVAPAGLGKTALAAEALRAILGDDARSGLAASPWPDGIVLLDLYRLKGSAQAAWDQLAEAFNQDASEKASARERAVAACRGRRALIVVEGAEEMNTGKALQDLLAVLPKECRRLVLTRTRAQDWTGRPLDLSGAALGEADGLGLLRALTGGRIADKVLAQAFREVHGHPLALTWLGHQMAVEDESPLALLAELRREGFARLHEAGREDRTLRWLYGRSARQVGDDGRAALAVAGLLAVAPFPLSAVAAVLGDGGDTRARDAIKSVVGQGLLRLATGRDGEPESWELTHAMAYHFARSTSARATEAVSSLGPWVESHIRGAVDHARDIGRKTGAPDLAPVTPALLHAVAILRADTTGERLQALANYLTWKFDDDLRGLGSLPLLRVAAEAVVSWLECAPVERRNDPAWARPLSTASDNLSDVLKQQGDLAAALTSFRASLAIRERLAQQDSSNVTARRDLFVSHNKVGDVLKEQGDLAAALASFRAGLAIAEQLAQRDPANLTAQRDLSVSHNKVGDVLKEQGDLGAALASFRAGLAIAEQLTQQAPSNLTVQRDLSVSHDRVGGVLEEQGDLAAALASFHASLAIRERLAQQDASNLTAQRDLSVSHHRVGDVLKEQGDLGAALASFRASLAIAERLAEQDPSNLTAQIDLVISCLRVFRAGADMPGEGRGLLERGLLILHELERASRLPPKRQPLIAMFEEALAAARK